MRLHRPRNGHRLYLAPISGVTEMREDGLSFTLERRLGAGAAERDAIAHRRDGAVEWIDGDLERIDDGSGLVASG